MKIYFTDFFNVSPIDLSNYGAFNISLINDLPAFIDPFLLFNSDKSEYQQLHHQIIEYVKFLRDMSAQSNMDKGLLKTLYQFPEVKQNWLGYSKIGNGGSGLGKKFSNALHENLHTIFHNFGEEQITKGSHLEKLCLVESGIGRDNISDFTTNLIKGFLCEYTQKFAIQYIEPNRLKEIAVSHVEFNYQTKSWVTKRFILPYIDGDFVLLTPKDILTKDEEWINRSDMIKDFDEIVASLPNDGLRSQINSYLQGVLSDNPNKKEKDYAIQQAFKKFPYFIDYYMKFKEDNGDGAVALSELKLNETEQLLINNIRNLVQILKDTHFYQNTDDTYQAALKRVHFLKQVIENNDGYKLFYNRNSPIKRESDLQVIYRLTWYATDDDVNAEVNNGRGPVDYKISRGSKDSTIVEFKLASNSKLKQNLQHQVGVYEDANQTKKSIKVILYFSESELLKVLKVLKDLKLEGQENIVLIDASKDNKISASNVK
ncbi:hypothetical protein [Wielerella bovis]|uniref:hypothetical protein n=1 Tax=Wielerella bovis TaxID=2917790 RepID=UPI002018E551|nr:hypothetical protein [Wielerella bovis]ULJ59885.1 hypothetical protein MIS44_09440 [Wielerella bovis]